MSFELKQYTTPSYIIHKKKFENNLMDIRDNFEKKWNGEVICSYSCKTNNNREMIKLAKEFNMYAEVVSAKEYVLAKEVGFNDEKIIYNGPFKGETVYEACNRGAIVNVDSLEELKELCYVYNTRYDRFPQNLGLRINFDLESVVPGQTSTGQEDGRFGICLENGDVERAIEFLEKNSIKLNGVHVHYTTRTRSLEVYSEIAKTVMKLIKKYELQLSYIDIGGGFWGGRKIDGKPTMTEYADVICNILDLPMSTTLILEPGSALCSTVVDYLARVISVKDIRESRFVFLDGTSLHINPFQFERDAQCVLEKQDETISEISEKKQILCGATCLEKDRFSSLKGQMKLEKGDLIRFINVGAYTMSFVSDFILEKPQIHVEE